MKTVASWLVGGLLLCLAPLALWAEEVPRARPGNEGISAAKLERAAALVQEMVDKKEYAGAVTLVARHGKVVHLKAVGLMDMASAKPMQTDTIFRIYSMTKPITSVAAMMLCEEGKLKLDDPVSKYIPELKGLRVYAGPGDRTVEARREITVRDLLRHTSGFTYGAFSDSPVDKLYREKRVLDRTATLEQFTAKLAKLPLLYQPGTRFHYGVSTDALGRVVEAASGKPLDEFFAQRIFQPLGMVDTGFYVPAAKIDRLATNYGPGDNGDLKVIDDPKKSPYAAPAKFLSGGGGLVSTAHDYLRFCQMMLNGGQLEGARLLKPDTVRDMTRNQLPPESLPMTLPTNVTVKGLGFGLGFAVWMEPALDTGTSAGDHYWGGAASTSFIISPRKQAVIICLTQFMPLKNKLSDAFRRGVNAAMADDGAASGGGKE